MCIFPISHPHQYVQIPVRVHKRRYTPTQCDVAEVYIVGGTWFVNVLNSLVTNDPLWRMTTFKSNLSLTKVWLAREVE